MNKPRKREHQEDRQTKEQVKFEHKRHIGDMICCTCLEGKDTLRPSHEFGHFMPIEVLERYKDRP